MDHPGTSGSLQVGNAHRSSLYVTGLRPETDEMELFEKFTTVGPVDSIRMVREMITFRPLGSAYVNFQRTQDAVRAFQTLNGDLIQHHPIQITWPEVDTVTPHVPAGILVKNLDETMDNQAVCDMFSSVGNVLSCKVALDMQGCSKGYAFVYFYATSSAHSAIDRVNGLAVNGSSLAVSPLFTKLHVKNFGDRLTQATLQELFAPYGSIKAHGVKSRGCGFVIYDSPEAAGHAMEALNGKALSDGKALRVVPVPQRDLQPAPRLAEGEAVEVFVRNLDASIDNRHLGELFAPYGDIQRGFIVKEQGKSKGFGFVTYASGEQAARAIVAMNDREVAGKRIFVVLARGKEKPKPVSVVNAGHEPTTTDDTADFLLKTITDPDELKSLLAHRLYPLVKACVNAQTAAGRITFQMVRQHSASDLVALLKDPKRLQTVAKSVAIEGFESMSGLRLQLLLLSSPANSAAA
uniref:Polyadenylate-binding protein n=1 Tax=Culex pipiens TaxID=7175 RepID=A0A8D8GH90_CULPI